MIHRQVQTALSIALLTSLFWAYPIGWTKENSATSSMNSHIQVEQRQSKRKHSTKPTSNAKAHPTANVLPASKSPEESAIMSSEPPLVLSLTLEDVLSRVSRNHPKLKGAELERRMASAKRLEKQGAFDPAITIEENSQRYNDNNKPGYAKFGTGNEAFVGFLTRYGAKVGYGYRYNYKSVKSPSSATGTAGEHFLSISLPLLRGAGINDKSAAERRALLGEPLANAEFNAYRLSLLLKASTSYWDWVAAGQKTGVGYTQLQLAEVRAQQVQQRVQAGDLPVIDSVEATQEVQRRQETLFKMIRDFQKTSFYVSNFLWHDNGEYLLRPTAEQVPRAMPEPEALSEADVMEARTVAVKNRPELAQINLSRDIADVDMSLAKNQLLPVVDLYASPGWDTGEKAIGPTLKAGVSMMVPLRNRTAKGQVEQSRLKLQKLDLERQAMLQQILLEVDDTASELNMAYERYKAANQAYMLARQLEEGERARFDLGDSTLFLVNQRERATAEARIKVIDIQAEYQMAAVRLLAVTGQL